MSAGQALQLFDILGHQLCIAVPQNTFYLHNKPDVGDSIPILQMVKLSLLEVK